MYHNEAGFVYQFTLLVLLIVFFNRCNPQLRLRKEDIVAELKIVAAKDGPFPASFFLSCYKIFSFLLTSHFDCEQGESLLESSAGEVSADSLILVSLESKMQLSATILSFLAASISLAGLVAADCSVYGPDDPANKPNFWYDETSLIKGSDNTYKLTKDYHGQSYTFTVQPGTTIRGNQGYFDYLKVESASGDWRQFKIKFKEKNGGIMKSYWSAKGADCTSSTRFTPDMITNVVVSERCYHTCPENAESP